MSQSPLVSIIIPVYNVELYLARCLNSIINQSYKNIEIILINDGSTDNSGKICDEYAKKDKRIFVFHKENAGVSTARNFGIKKSTGEYIRFIDSDDDIPLDSTAELVQNMLQDNYDIVQGGFVVLNDKGKSIKKLIPLNNRAMSGLEYYTLKMKSDLPYHWLCCLFSAKFLKEENITFLEGLHPYEDTLFIAECFCKASKMLLLNRNIYNYYLYGESRDLATSGWLFIDLYKGDLKLMNLVFPFYKDTQNEKILFGYFLKKYFCCNLINLKIYNDFFGKDKTNYIIDSLFKNEYLLRASKHFSAFIKVDKSKIPFSVLLFCLLKIKSPIFLLHLNLTFWAFIEKIRKKKHKRVRSIEIR